MPGLRFLRARLDRLGALNQLKYWWSDRCCDGADDPSKHVLCDVFPSMKRAPYRDCYHAINAVNKTGHEGLPEQKAELGNDLFTALRQIPEQARCYNHVMLVGVIAGIIITTIIITTTTTTTTI